MPVISSNTAASTALLYVNQNTLKENSDLAQLSSGSRVQKASDDAASLAIGTQLSADVAALSQAATNAATGASVLQTADGALAQTSAILSRLQVLSTESQSGSVDDTSRVAINTEYQQLLAELDSIQQQTKFNGSNLIDGTYSKSYLLGTGSADTITVALSQNASSIGLGLATASTTVFNAATTSSAGTATVSGTPTATGNHTLQVTQQGAHSVLTGTATTALAPSTAIAGAPAALTVTINAVAYTTADTFGTAGTAANNTVQGAIDELRTALGTHGTVSIDAAGHVSVTAASYGQIITYTASVGTTAVFGAGLTASAGATYGYSLDGGSVVNINTNTIANIIPGVTATLGSLGTTTIGVTSTPSSYSGTSSSTSTATISGAPTATGSHVLAITRLATAGSVTGGGPVGYVAGTGVYTPTAGQINITVGSNTYTATINGGAGATIFDAVNNINAAIGSAGTATFNYNAGAGTGAITITAANVGQAVTVANVSVGTNVTHALGLDVVTTNNPATAQYTIDGGAIQNSSTNTLSGSAAVISGLTTTVVAVGSTTITATNNSTSVDTAINATTALTAIQAAVTAVNTERAAVGAYESRFTFRSNVINTSQQNLDAARATLEDADVAAVENNYTSVNTLTQAGIAALQKANQIPAELLRLLQQ